MTELKTNKAPEAWEYEITAEDLIGAVPRDGCKCVVANCIRRVTGASFVSVEDPYVIEVESEYYSVSLNAVEVELIIGKFDGGESLEDMIGTKFELEHRNIEEDWDLIDDETTEGE